MEVLPSFSRSANVVKNKLKREPKSVGAAAWNGFCFFSSVAISQSGKGRIPLFLRKQKNFEKKN